VSSLPTLVSSENGWKGLLVAMEMLRDGASALDAVEAATRIVEDDPDDHSVGFSGMANAAGDVELDASIMDGESMAAGAVAAIRGYAHPITLARKVLEMTPHVLLVGRGGERLAAEAGFAEEEMHTDRSQEIWRERFSHYGMKPNGDGPLAEVATLLTRPLELDRSIYFETPETGLRTGTVNFLALDRLGKMASAVSTSGMAWKYPGRVGDSPIIGAGNYCDGRYGAAACTGIGELAIRAGTARSVILYMKMGMSLQDAGLEALRDMTSLGYDGAHSMNIVALAPSGEHAGFSTTSGRRYLYMRADMSEPEYVARSEIQS
jgi:beta-aspartyl-peptidase (threonine type)